MTKVFLGGTCNKSNWRKRMILLLKKYNLDYFDPVVDDWTSEAQEIEIQERKTSDFVLYTITPKMLGVYSIAEVVDDSNKRPKTTIFLPLRVDGKDMFDKSQWKSLQAVGEMVTKNGGHAANSLESAAKYMVKN